MINPEAIVQLARLTGRSEFLRHLEIDGADLPAALQAVQLGRLRDWVDERAELLATGLLEEAMASDDVQDSAAALAYLDDRLQFFDELLTEEQRQRILRSFRAGSVSWG